MPGSSILFITHAEGGGVERHLTERLHALHRAGQAWLVLRPGGFGEDAVLHTSNPLLPERRYRLPAKAAALEETLRANVARRIWRAEAEPGTSVEASGLRG